MVTTKETTTNTIDMNGIASLIESTLFRPQIKSNRGAAGIK